MRVGDKIAPLHHPIFKPANLPDFLAVARMCERGTGQTNLLRPECVKEGQVKRTFSGLRSSTAKKSSPSPLELGAAGGNATRRKPLRRTAALLRPEQRRSSGWRSPRSNCC